VVAYGALVPRAALDVPAHGWVNLHFSLLPAWRGAAPVQRALMAGDDVTGATTFVLEEGLDTGPVLGTLTETVRPDDTSGTLLDRLAHAGAGLLVATMDGLADGSLHAVPQPVDGVSLAPKLSTEEARVRWGLPAHVVDRQVRGCTPAPGAWTTFRGERLKVGPVRFARPGGEPRGAGPGGPHRVMAARDAVVLEPGELHVTKRAVLVGTGSTPVELGEVGPTGRKPMAAADWARGIRIAPGERLDG
jgi:methionyl-tRNA formyltransferase